MSLRRLLQSEPVGKCNLSLCLLSHFSSGIILDRIAILVFGGVSLPLGVQSVYYS